jgi:O-antigen/teichoic acid export membrane protein
MKEEKKLFSNTFYIFLDYFFISLFSFLYILTLWKFLPPQDFGIIATVTNLSLLVSNICFLGLNAANSKLISEYAQRKQFKKIGSLLRFSLSVSLILSFIFSLLIYLSYLIFPTTFKLPFDSLLIGCVSIFLIITYGIFGSVVYGLQNMKKFFFSDLVGYFFRFSLALLFLFLGFGYLGALIPFALSYLFSSLIRFEGKWFSFSDKIDKKFVIKNYAIPAFFMAIFSLFINNSQYVILTFIQNPEVTGIFGTALTISFVITLIPNILSASFFPIISQLSVTKKKQSKQSYLTSLVTRYILLFSLPSILFFSIFSKELVLFFSGQEYFQSTQFLPLLTLASFFFGFGNFFLNCLYGIRKTTLTRNISLFFTFIFLISALPLTYFLSSWGLSTAYFLAMIFYFSTNFILVKKFLKLKSLAKPLIKILFASFVFGLLLFSSEIFGFRLYSKILVLLVAGLFYFLLLIPLRFYQKEEVRILNYFGRKAPFFKNFFFKLANFLSKYVS